MLLYKGVDKEKPYGKEMVIILENIDIPIKQLFELMSISPERKIVVKGEDSIGVITLSNIFEFIMENNLISN